MSRPTTLRRALAIVILTPAIGMAACGEDETRTDNSSSTGEQVGQSCAVPGECYPDVAHPDGGTDAGSDAGADAGTSGGIRGTVVCLTKVTGGYCTHTCVDDSDCCAVPGECKTGHPQVCSPFENQAEKYCFLSCEDDIVGTTDPNTYCHDFANIEFGCRSTGGGSQNRKICLL